MKTRRHADKILNDLKVGNHGGAIKIPDTISEEARVKFHQVVSCYDQYAFWRRGDDLEYRKEKTLWLPQRRAVLFANIFLATMPKAGKEREAALIKMPTGTGKTAVIATIACLSPIAPKTLIITPRVALVRQMREDLCYNFWKKVGALYSQEGLKEGMSKERAEEEGKRLLATGHSPIRTLIAEQYAQIWKERNNERQIYVGTFNALHAVLGVEPPAHRSTHGRTIRRPAKSIAHLEEGTSDDDKEYLSEESVKEFREHLASVDLVIIDEGHYEPAYAWRQAVKKVGKPTIVFTATPYRNDYKYFEVQGRYVFNLSWQEAVDKKLIRDVRFHQPIGLKFGLYQRRMPKGKRSPHSLYPAEEFVKDFAATLETIPEGKKVIVHGATYATLKRLQRAFHQICKCPAVLIHDRVRSTEEENLPDLKQFSTSVQALLGNLRFRHVAEAKESERALGAKVWLHQYKLLEGIDHDSFVEIWLYDGFGSARQLVQQVGRAVRMPSLSDPDGKVARIRGSGMPLESYLGASTVSLQLQQRWNDYLHFEEYARSRPEIAFTAETQLMATLKRTAPAVQYINGEFRGGHLLDEHPYMTIFQLPRRAVICRVDGVTVHGANAISMQRLDDLQSAAHEAMYLEERFDIQNVAPPPGVSGYDDIRMIRYLAWNNSRYLVTHHIPEWRLGFMAIVRAGRYIFLLDTEGVCLDPARVGLLSPEPVELERLFPTLPGSPLHRVRIVEASASGLDVSEVGIRSMSIRKSTLDESYFDLAESTQVPSMVRGTGPLAKHGVRRRLSFTRASVTDATSRMIPVLDYIAWSKDVADMLADESVVPHAFFNRFARLVPPLDPEEARPISILLDLWDLLDVPEEIVRDREWDKSKVEELLSLKNETCIDITTEEEPSKDGGEPRLRHYFTFAERRLELKYILKETIPPTSRYKIIDDDDQLEEVVADDSIDAGELQIDPEDQAFGRKLAPSLLRMINSEQSFRIIPSRPSTIYAHGHFYEPEIDESILGVIEVCAQMGEVVSEKGDTRLRDKGNWSRQTLFGKVYEWFQQGAGLPVNPNHSPIASDIAGADLLICDDRNREGVDFFIINHTNRAVYLLHAKADSGTASSSARKIQEVARQAQTSLAFAGAARTFFDTPPEWERRWSVTLKDAKKAVVTKPRILMRSAKKMNATAASGALNEVLGSGSYRTEIIMLTANLLSSSDALRAFQSQSPSDRQFIYFLASLRTTFDRAGIVFRIVANP